MQPRANKEFDFVITVAINLASYVSLTSAEKLMVDSGIPETTIERILYDPNNIRNSVDVFIDWSAILILSQKLLIPQKWGIEMLNL